MALRCGGDTGRRKHRAEFWFCSDRSWLRGFGSHVTSLSISLLTYKVGIVLKVPRCIKEFLADSRLYVLQLMCGEIADQKITACSPGIKEMASEVPVESQRPDSELAAL